MSRLSRRKFLKTSAIATGAISANAAGFWLAGGVEAQEKKQAANERLNIAVIGCGGQGGGNLNNVSRENIVALCDVDDARARDSFNRYPNVEKFKDFRVMLDRVRNIDAVVVSTPDHTHAIAAITAMRAGKHCYCEKPLTHSVWEARQMRDVARQQRVATQMGNQGTSNGRLREGVEAIRAGAIGPVTEVHCWTNRPIWPQPGRRPKETPAVPATLDWNLWQGPAPERPFHTAYLPFNWRGWWDYGTGALGDMGCHTMNLPYMALRLGAPRTVEANIDGTLNNESPPMGSTVTYEFAAQGDRPEVKFYWYERRQPPAAVREGIEGNLPGSGCIMVGRNGRLYSPSDYGGEWRLLPQDLQASFRAPERSLPRANGHHREWIDACKGGPAAMSNFVDYAAALTEFVLLGNVAIRVGQKFTWDSENLRATDCPRAAQYIRREYRQGWNI
jgi:predicted dehydrogenase